jgi:hypothetical protein
MMSKAVGALPDEGGVWFGWLPLLRGRFSLLYLFFNSLNNDIGLLL